MNTESDNNKIPSDILAEFDGTLAGCRAFYLREKRLNAKSYTAEIVSEAYDTAFRQAYVLGVGQAYARGNITRLEVATSAMQGLLSSGYMPEHGDIPAEAVRLADRLIDEISKPREL